MSRRTRIAPKRYQRISLRQDPEGRTHHAIVFNVGKLPEEAMLDAFVARCKLPEILTWTPTGHGKISNWDFADSTHSKQLSEGELALLVPRSLWMWFVPGFVRAFTPLRWLIPQHPKDLFCLEEA